MSWEGTSDHDGSGGDQPDTRTEQNRDRDRARRALVDVETWWPTLLEERHPSTRRAQDPVRVADDQLQAQERDGWRQRDEQAAYARASRTMPTRLTPSPAPVRVAVLDTIDIVTARILDTEDYMREHLAAPAVRRDKSQPLEPYVILGATWIRSHLHRVDNDMAAHIAAEARAAANSVHRAIGLTEPRRLLTSPCPICSLRSLEVLTTEDPWLIVCTANRGTTIACQCTDPGCGCHHGQRHSWPEPAWERNGLRLRQAVEQALTQGATA